MECLHLVQTMGPFGKPLCCCVSSVAVSQITQAVTRSVRLGFNTVHQSYVLRLGTVGQPEHGCKCSHAMRGHEPIVHGVTKQLQLLYATLCYCYMARQDGHRYALLCMDSRQTVHAGCGIGRAVTAFSSMRRKCNRGRLRVKQASLQ